MPTYEYECTKCNYHFDKFQSMSDAPLSRCPKCRCKVKRLIGTGAGIIFKGSGFYETDYRSKNYQESVKKEKETPKEASSEKKEQPKKKDSDSKRKDKVC